MRLVSPARPAHQHRQHADQGGGHASEEDDRQDEREEASGDLQVRRRLDRGHVAEDREAEKDEEEREIPVRGRREPARDRAQGDEGGELGPMISRLGRSSVMSSAPAGRRTRGFQSSAGSSAKRRPCSGRYLLIERRTRVLHERIGQLAGDRVLSGGRQPWTEADLSRTGKLRPAASRPDNQKGRPARDALGK